MSTLCEHLIQQQTPSLEGRKISTRLCPDKAQQIHIYRKQYATVKEIHYYCKRHSEGKRVWHINSTYDFERYRKPQITLAVVPVDDSPIPMEFWDNSNLNPEDFPYFADLYAQTYGSVPVKKVVTPHNLDGK